MSDIYENQIDEILDAQEIRRDNRRLAKELEIAKAEYQRLRINLTYQQFAEAICKPDEFTRFESAERRGA